MKVLYNLLGILCSFCLIIILLITSVEAVAYWTPGYYEKEYSKYHVTEAVHMEMDDLLTVTYEMMDYLKVKGQIFILLLWWTDRSGSFLMSGKSPIWRMCVNLFLGGITLRRTCMMAASVMFITSLIFKSGH